MKKLIFIFSIIMLISFIKESYSGYYLGAYSSLAAGRMVHKQWLASSQQLYNNYLVGGGGVLQIQFKSRGSYNYRLYIGFDKVYIPRTTRQGTDYNDTIRGNVINQISYALHKKRNYQLWIGPQIGFHLVWGNNYKSDRKVFRDGITSMPFLLGASSIPAYYLIDSLYKSERYTDFIFSFAPVIGIDITPSEIFNISLESGLRIGIHLPVYKSYSSGTFYRYEGFFNISFLFRIKKGEYT